MDIANKNSGHGKKEIEWFGSAINLDAIIIKRRAFDNTSIFLGSFLFDVLEEVIMKILYDDLIEKANPLGT